MIQIVTLFISTYTAVKPLSAELGGTKGIIKDGLAVLAAYQTAHASIIAAKAPASDGGATVTLAEGEPIAILFVESVGRTIAANAGLTDETQILAFVEKLGAVIFSKVFAHFTGTFS